MARRATILIEAETGSAREEVEQLEGALEEADVAAVEVGDGFDRMSQRVSESTAQTRQEVAQAGRVVDEFSGKAQTMRSSATSSANALGFELVQGAQDAKFGVAGLANQIPLMSEQFSRLQAKTGSATGALRALGSAFLGPTGVIAAVTLGITFLPDLIDSLSDAGNAAEKADDQFQGFLDSSQNLSQELPNLDQAVKGVESALEGVNLQFLSRASGSQRLRQLGGGAVRQELESLRDVLRQDSDAARALKSSLRNAGVDIETVLSPNLEEATAEINRNITAFARLGEQVRSFIDDPAVLADNIRTSFEQLEQNVGNQVEAGLIEPTEAAQQRVDFLETALKQARRAFSDLSDEEFSAEFGEFLQDLDEARKRLDKLEGEGGSTSALENLLGSAKDKTKELLGEYVALTGEQGEQLTQQRRFNEAMKRTISRLQRRRELRAQLQALGLGQINLRRPQAAPTPTREAPGTRTDPQGAAADAAAATVQGSGQQLGQMQRTAKRLRAMNSEANTFEKKTDEVDQNIGRLITAAGQLGQVLARAFQRGEVSASSFIGSLLQTTGGVLTAIPGVGQVAGPSLSAVGGIVGQFEDGGTIPRTGTALVGEAGPELVTLPKNTEVSTNRETRAMMDTTALEKKVDRLTEVLIQKPTGIQEPDLYRGFRRAENRISKLVPSAT